MRRTPACPGKIRSKGRLQPLGVPGSLPDRADPECSLTREALCMRADICALFKYVFDLKWREGRRFEARAAAPAQQRALAPRAGFEPATIRLTVECSTAELPRNRRTRRFAMRGAYNKAFRACKGPNRRLCFCLKPQWKVPVSQRFVAASPWADRIGGTGRARFRHPQGHRP